MGEYCWRSKCDHWIGDHAGLEWECVICDKGVCPTFMRKPKRMPRRALSPETSTLLLVVITVALSIVLYILIHRLISGLQ